ncbi:MAG: hypothetical protein K0U98_04900 [Deltaproteobacteria bacterium]|nr:hypothetical protein [Deltaproteobacteria bacterium]
MKGSPLLIKIMIVLFVFPIFALVGSSIFGLVLIGIPALLFEAPLEDILLPFQIVTQVAGIIVAFGVSWSIWPKRKEMENEEGLTE